LTLKDEFGFPDAAVQRFTIPGGARHTVVTVVEPHRASLVRFRPWRAGTEGGRAEWHAGFAVFNDHGREFQIGLSAYGLLESGRAREAYERVRSLNLDSLAVERIWDFLRAHDTAADRALALGTLYDDENFANRALAAAILSNFPDDDIAWWALVDALRDPVGIVAATASDALKVMTGYAARAVDWGPAAENLRDVLNGTNLFMLHATMELLVDTQVAPELAPSLLRDGGHLVLANLAASRPAERDRAHALLMQLSGQDLGTEPAAWESWIRSLAG
jgi:hypothetical protein